MTIPDGLREILDIHGLFTTEPNLEDVIVEPLTVEAAIGSFLYLQLSPNSPMTAHSLQMFEVDEENIYRKGLSYKPATVADIADSKARTKSYWRQRYLLKNLGVPITDDLFCLMDPLDVRTSKYFFTADTTIDNELLKDAASRHGLSARTLYAQGRKYAENHLEIGKDLYIKILSFGLKNPHIARLHECLREM